MNDPKSSSLRKLVVDGAYESQIVQVKFCLKYRTSYGQTVKLLGSHPQLGEHSFRGEGHGKMHCVGKVVTYSMTQMGGCACRRRAVLLGRGEDGRGRVAANRNVVLLARLLVCANSRLPFHLG